MSRERWDPGPRADGSEVLWLRSSLSLQDCTIRLDSAMDSGQARERYRLDGEIQDGWLRMFGLDEAGPEASPTPALRAGLIEAQLSERGFETDIFLADERLARWSRRAQPAIYIGWMMASTGVIWGVSSLDASRGPWMIAAGAMILVGSLLIWHFSGDEVPSLLLQEQRRALRFIMETCRAQLVEATDGAGPRGEPDGRDERARREGRF